MHFSFLPPDWAKFEKVRDIAIVSNWVDDSVKFETRVDEKSKRVEVKLWLPEFYHTQKLQVKMHIKNKESSFINKIKLPHKLFDFEVIKIDQEPIVIKSIKVERHLSQ